LSNKKEIKKRDFTGLQSIVFWSIIEKQTGKIILNLTKQNQTEQKTE